jgi:hypothetical protein
MQPLETNEENPVEFLRHKMIELEDAGRDPWKVLNPELLAWLVVPHLNGSFELHRDPNGTEKIMSVSGTFQMDDYNLRQSVHVVLRGELGRIPPDRIITAAVNIWRRETNPSEASPKVTTNAETNRFQSVWEQCFQSAPGKRLPAGVVRAELIRVGLTDHEIARFKTWAEATHKVKYRRTATDRWYDGIALGVHDAPTPDDDDMTTVTAVIVPRLPVVTVLPKEEPEESRDHLRPVLSDGPREIPSPETPPLFSEVVGPTHRETFTIKVFRERMEHYLRASDIGIDPTCGNSTLGTYRNDKRQSAKGKITNMHALAFLEDLKSKSVEADWGIVDPVYSAHQAKLCYEGHGADENPAAFYAKLMEGMDPLLKVGAITLTFSFQAAHFGKARGYRKLETIMLNPPGMHYPTYMVIEVKEGIASQQNAA